MRPAPRRLARAGWLLCLLAVLPAPACRAQGPGAYDAEIAAMTRRVDADPGDHDARRALARALMLVGRHEEAERVARAAGPDAPELANVLGEALLARGERAGAEAAFRRAASGAPDSLAAQLNLAVLLHDRGEHEEAMRRFDRFIDAYNRSASLPAPALTAVGTAVRYLGARDPQLFRDALKAYDEAIAADPDDPEPRVRLAELFLEKYNSPDAQATLKELLERHPSHPRGLLALARARHFDGSPESLPLVRRALEVNPNLVAARVFLARLYLENEDLPAAEAEIRRALEVNPASLEALSVLAGIHYLRGDRAEYEETRRRVLGLNPRYADVYVTVGELAVRARRYRDAAELARQGAELDPASWSALGLLGLNELRLGRADAARAALERSFRGDPYNVWVKNTLDLLDTYPRYRTVRTPRFELFLHADEADLLGPYAAALAEEAYARLAERYGYRPEVPVRVEFYPSHADFSVRSVGLAGLGALGVSFGNVLALDSPSAREKGQFNWGSTLWHEIAHAVTLGLSNHRVPRWLTEGLAVLEERRARPGWGSESDASFLLAYRDGELPPATRLSEAFVRPASPRHLAHAYHHASLVAEWIEERHGFDAILRMLRGYGEGRSTDELVRSVLRSDPDRFDREFDAWLRERHAAQLAALGRLMRNADGVPAPLAEAMRDLEQGRLEEARRALERGGDALAGLLGDGSAYALLAEIHLKQGNPRAAAQALAKLTALNENAYGPNLQLADLLLAQGDRAGAAEALERALYVYPLEIPLHARLAELYEQLGRAEDAVRERRAVVALRPVDRADALYRLALALLRAGDREGARREVLRALEAAPTFPEAQELLLRLSGASEAPAP